MSVLHAPAVGGARFLQRDCKNVWSREVMSLIGGSGPTSGEQTSQTQILIVEDDLVVSGLMRDAFEREGFVVSEVRNGRELHERLSQQPISLVTLDLGLPNEDGLELARQIRATSDVPIIIVTGKSRKISTVVGLEVGADDYVVKPFDLDELIARIRAILRRSRRTASPSQPEAPTVKASPPASVVVFDGWRFDMAGHRLWAPMGEAVDLTSAETELLKIFMRQPRTALTRAAIAEALRGEGDTSSERSIDVLVGRLRRKLEKHAKGTDIIKTLRGEGYLLAAEVQSEPGR